MALPVLLLLQKLVLSVSYHCRWGGHLVSGCDHLHHGVWATSVWNLGRQDHVPTLSTSINPIKHQPFPGSATPQRPGKPHRSLKVRYKRIRMNQYSFPDSVRVSGQVKDPKESSVTHTGQMSGQMSNIWRDALGLAEHMNCSNRLVSRCPTAVWNYLLFTVPFIGDSLNYN